MRVDYVVRHRRYLSSSLRLREPSMVSCPDQMLRNSHPMLRHEHEAFRYITNPNSYEVLKWSDSQSYILVSITWHLESDCILSEWAPRSRFFYNSYTIRKIKSYAYIQDNFFSYEYLVGAINQLSGSSRKEVFDFFCNFVWYWNALARHWDQQLSFMKLFEAILRNLMFSIRRACILFSYIYYIDGIAHDQIKSEKNKNMFRLPVEKHFV